MTITKLTKDQWGKVLKALGYVVASSVIAWAIALVTEQPELFGVYTPIVNIILVTAKQALTEGK